MVIHVKTKYWYTSLHNNLNEYLPQSGLPTTWPDNPPPHQSLADTSPHSSKQPWTQGDWIFHRTLQWLCQIMSNSGFSIHYYFFSSIRLLNRTVRSFTSETMYYQRQDTTSESTFYLNRSCLHSYPTGHCPEFTSTHDCYQPWIVDTVYCCFHMEILYVNIYKFGTYSMNIINNLLDKYFITFWTFLIV